VIDKRERRIVGGAYILQSRTRFYSWKKMKILNLNSHILHKFIPLLKYLSVASLVPFPTQNKKINTGFLGLN